MLYNTMENELLALQEAQMENKGRSTKRLYEDFSNSGKGVDHF